jgi:hypothetical protein
MLSARSPSLLSSFFVLCLSNFYIHGLYVGHLYNVYNILKSVLYVQDV